MSNIETRQDIRNLSCEELARYCASINEPAFRSQQIFEWIYNKGAGSFEAMCNLPGPLRQSLSKDFNLPSLRVAAQQTARDSTTKFLFELKDHEKVETVLIPTASRTTVCVSTQAGCKFGCRFCASGLGGWKRDLSCAEILTQILHVKEEALKHQSPLSNIVFMGTGEPLDNYENLLKSIRIINDSRGLAIGARRITISTCGIIPGIQRLACEGLQVELAVSLHGYDDDSRAVLMPVSRKYPFSDLMKACREYTRATKRQITFEYILIRDLTCTETAALALKKAFKGIICKMNLIPYNPVAEFDFEPPSKLEMRTFKTSLSKCGIHATVRMPRGRDISAACGQLRHAVRQSNQMA